uniref:Ras GTPase-activating protein n=1 Tax=Acrobeloides nanus TaxID=290746 RepID=A0A914E5R6_9BILA
MCESRASTSTSLTKTSISSSRNSEKVGEMRLRIWHSIDQILPLVHYQPLYSNLMNSLNMQPQSASLTSLLQCLPIELENLAKPLMRIYFHSNQIRAFFRNICSQYVSSCHDVNTLFRSQSMTSKVLHEFMMFVGHPYLVLSLKPLIDLICVERKCCEIDPAKLKPGDSLEQNMRNLMVYAELAFSQVVGSRSRCPQVLREIFADLRDVVSQFYPRRIEVSRLALSSFLIMRFFAPAILNPKLFDRKRAPPDGDVQRTLILISKILQRLANCVVSTHPLTQKEEWLTPVLTRFSDDHHKSAMIEFLDSVSASGGELSPISKDAGFLKEGIMVERRSGPEKRRSIKNFIHQKRRYVMLTEKELTWQKVKESSGEMATKRAFPLDEITSVNVLTDAKNAFRVSTQTGEVHFQASSPAEMNEWMILIQKQQRRHIMVKNRPSGSDLVELVDIDIELELETIHCILMENRDTLVKWLAALNGDENTPRFPEELLKNLRTNEEHRLLMETLRKSIKQTLDSIDQIEGVHKIALNSHQTKNFQPQKDERPLTDNENYLLMRGERKRRKQFN